MKPMLLLAKKKAQSYPKAKGDNDIVMPRKIKG
jgi:hypothetical protein